jgi:hypothetical protein
MRIESRTRLGVIPGPVEVQNHLRLPDEIRVVLHRYSLSFAEVGSIMIRTDHPTNGLDRAPRVGDDEIQTPDVRGQP